MRSHGGVTLIELVVALAVLAILATVALPSTARFLRHNQLAAHSNAFMANLQLARSEAVKTGQSVVMCKASAGKCVQSGDWRHAWMVFEDPTGSGSCADADEDGLCNGHGGRVLRYNEISFTPDVMQGNRNVRHRIRFGNLGTMTSGRIWICDRSYPELSREIVLHWTGRARIALAPDPCPAP